MYGMLCGVWVVWIIKITNFPSFTVIDVHMSYTTVRNIACICTCIYIKYSCMTQTYRTVLHGMAMHMHDCHTTIFIVQTQNRTPCPRMICVGAAVKIQTNFCNQLPEY